MPAHRILPLIALSSMVACAPAVPEETSGGTTYGDPLESFVLANYSVFTNLESLAVGSGLDLESDEAGDWPEGGEATVTFGSSNVAVNFEVDRVDFSRVSRVWTVSLSLEPLVAGGDPFEGDLAGTWTYWEEVEGDPSATWVQLDLTGMVNYSGTSGEELTELSAIINGNGQIWETDVMLGEDTFAVDP